MARTTKKATPEHRPYLVKTGFLLTARPRSLWLKSIILFNRVKRFLISPLLIGDGVKIRSDDVINE